MLINSQKFLIIIMIVIVIIMLISYSFQKKKQKNKFIINSMLVVFIIGLIFILLTKTINKQENGNSGNKLLKCNSINDCPNSSSKKFTCKNNECVLDPETKKDIIEYMDSVYPGVKTQTSSNLTDVELYNFFMFLCYYWISYHNDVKGIIHYVDPNFPTSIQCGGYYSRGDSDSDICGSNPSTAGAATWPQGVTGKPLCCKRGTLSFPPEMNQLYFCDYIEKDIEVLRNGYDYKDFFNKSVLYDPIYLHKINKLNVKDPTSYLPYLKNGIDNQGINVNYNVCDGSKPYDFTKLGPGYNSNSLAECTRDHGVGGSPDVFYYIAAGTGNFLDLGVTIRAMNKIHAALLIIKRAGEMNFGSFTTYKLQPPTYTDTKQKVTLKDKTISNSFTETPQLLLLEYFNRSSPDGGYKYTMNCPNTKPEFGTAEATKAAENVDWPFKEGGVGWEGEAVVPRSAPQIPFTHILKWFFGYKKTTLPDITDYKNNWSSWNTDQVEVLGQFFDSITNPIFDNWQLNYTMNRVANSADIDVLVYQFINPGQVEITGQSLDVNPKDVKGNSWNGIKNYDNKPIETLSLVIQPGGAGGWAYELTDYRLSIKASNGAASYWNKYTTKFLKTGNPLSNQGLYECTPTYCTKDGDPNCEPIDPTQREDASWKIIKCQSKVHTKPNWKCNTDDGKCSEDSTGNYTDQESCMKVCEGPQPPTGNHFTCNFNKKICQSDSEGSYTNETKCNTDCKIAQCTDKSDGATRNYCSNWCNTNNIWPCGVNSDETTTCNCTGCNGCK